MDPGLPSDRGHGPAPAGDAPPARRRWLSALKQGRARRLLAPQGSRRARALRAGWKAALLWRRHGLRVLAGEALRGRASREAWGSLLGESSPYAMWLRNNAWNERALDEAEHDLARLARRPLFSLAMSLDESAAPRLLARAAASLRAQVYPHWELHIAADAPARLRAGRLLARLVAEDPRISVVDRPASGGEAPFGGPASSAARGEFLVPFDAGDALAPDALLEFARALDRDPGLDLIYADEDAIDDRGSRHSPAFKPGWSPELLLSTMYLGRGYAVRRPLFEAIGGLRPGFGDSTEHDLALRVADRTDRVAHVASVLYHRRPRAGEDFAPGERAVAEALARRGVAGRASRPEFALREGLGIFQVDFPDDGPRVAILIPTKNRLELLRTCISSILERTTYRNYQIFVIDDRSDDPETLAYLRDMPDDRCWVIRNEEGGRFNYARLNNRAVARVDAELVVFLNNDTEVRRSEWLSQLVGYSKLPGVGAVGARLLLRDGRVQHAGVLAGLPRGLAGHAFRLLPGDDRGYLGHAALARNYSGVTAACMLARRSTFLEHGGFDEERFAVAYNDVDFCLRLREAGLRSVYAPRAELFHYENASRGPVDDPREPLAFLEAWGGRPDPYYNRNLARDDERFAICTRRASARVAPHRPPIRALLCVPDLRDLGPARTAFELALGLKARGKIAPELASPDDGPLAPACREAGIPVRITGRISDAHSDHKDALLAAAFAKIMRDGDVRVVHASALAARFAIEAAARARVPSLWSLCEGDIPPDPRARGGAEALRAFAAPYRVLFGSYSARGPFGALETRHNFGVVPEAPRRDDIDRFLAEHTPDECRERVGCPAKAVAVTFLGAPGDRDGAADAVRAAVALLSKGRRDLFLSVAADLAESDAEALGELARGHERSVRIVPGGDPLLYGGAADVLVCGARGEGPSRALMRALAFGRPVVMASGIGAAEPIAPGAGALIYEPGDHGTLAGHLRRLMDDAGMRRSLAGGASATLGLLGSPEEMIMEYERLFIEAYLTDSGGASRVRARAAPARLGVA